MVAFISPPPIGSIPSAKVCRVKRPKLEIGHLGLARPHFEELRVPDDHNVPRRAQLGRRGKEAGKLAAALGDCDRDAKQGKIIFGKMYQKSMSTGSI